LTFLDRIQSLAQGETPCREHPDSGCCQPCGQLVEHPERVADHIITIAEIVGQENIIAGTDCGLGGRVHPQIAWAKLRALRDGAANCARHLLKLQNNHIF